MITEPDPTLVMPTSSPPTAPTRNVGSGRIRGSVRCGSLSLRTCRSWM